MSIILSGRTVLLTVICATVFFPAQRAFSQCKECEEVAKEQIPVQYLHKGVKELPSTIKIWDNEEAIPALNKNDPNVLWVDTRPKSLFLIGTIKNSVNLFCDKKGAPIPESENDIALTAERLKAAMKNINADLSKVIVIYFCQGPKCHRSYNAALRSVAEYGFPASQVIWYRDGYPGLLEFIKANPKYSKKIGFYLQGSDVAE